MPLVSLLPFLQGKPFLSSPTESCAGMVALGIHLIKVLSEVLNQLNLNVGREGGVLMPTMLSLHILVEAVQLPTKHSQFCLPL